MLHATLPKWSLNQLKPVQQRIQQALRAAYCPNIHILCYGWFLANYSLPKWVMWWGFKVQLLLAHHDLYENRLQCTIVEGSKEISQYKLLQKWFTFGRRGFHMISLYSPQQFIICRGLRFFAFTHIKCRKWKVAFSKISQDIFN